MATTVEDDLTMLRKRAALLKKAKDEGYEDLTDEATRDLTPDELRDAIRERRRAKGNGPGPAKDDNNVAHEPLTLVAIPTHQLGRDCFQTKIRLRHLDRLTIDPDAQRKLEKRRLPELSSYILREDGYFAGIVVTIVGDVTYDGDEEFGRLVISEGATMLVGEGQHRVEGYRRAISDDPDAMNERLDTDDIPMLVYVELSKSEQRQMFADINMNLKKPNRAISLDYDERNVLGEFTKKVIERCDAFGWKRVARAKTKIGAKDAELWTFTTIVDAVAEMFDKDALSPDTIHRNLDEAVAYWNAVGQAMMPTWEAKNTIANVKNAMVAIGGLYGMVGLNFDKLASVDWSEGGELDLVAKMAGGSNAATKALKTALAERVIE